MHWYQKDLPGNPQIVWRLDFHFQSTECRDIDVETVRAGGVRECTSDPVQTVQARGTLTIGGGVVVVTALLTVGLDVWTDGAAGALISPM